MLSRPAILVCSMLGAACARTAEAQAPAPPEALAIASGESSASPFWWTHFSASYGAGVWFGPVLVKPNGQAIRHWVLLCGVPGAETPWAVFQSEVLLDDALPIGAFAGEWNLELAPPPGSTWRDVSAPELLDARLEGLLAIESPGASVASPLQSQ